MGSDTEITGLDELKQQVENFQQIAEDAQQQALIASQALAEYITESTSKGDEQ